ncbi:MAG TPA: sigma-E processing peptidase SpoIIGA [Symbiobacteriaceae bacterium]|nr:sigma-E processing peptidase SpoIIGA [Symbiobacteriaceae bacterium]
MIRIVSVDVVFLANFAMDLVWLWVTASLAGLRAGRWRMAGAAAAGGLLAVWAWFDSGLWLRSPAGAAAGTLLLLAVAFAPCRLQQAGRLLGYFLLSGAAIAGTVSLVQLRMPGAGLYMPRAFAGGLVVGGLLLCALGARQLWQAAHGRALLVRGLWSLGVTIGGQSVTLPALVDTGNHLRDPLAGTPVAVVEAAALRQALPPDVYRAVAAGWEGLERLPGEWAARCRLVPYRAVGRPDGMLLALAPDQLTVTPPGGGTGRAVPGLVGLSVSPLHPEGRYRALLPGELASDEN